MDATNVTLMTANGHGDATTGGLVTGNCTITPSGDWWPWSNNYFYGYYYPTPEPTTCIGKAHVFECDHVKKCKCGSVERVMPKTKRVR
jgi:hypothetical protein